ncbi:hypothetical protein B0H10DRAFT_1953282 [Mycena sp. CBHHK59/15]|nr:hypothetical protein B0H10DRAFT_1953282 [Mycena sp. CBHHK59/15]
MTHLFPLWEAHTWGENLKNRAPLCYTDHWDPSADTCPDFSSAAFNIVHNIIMTGDPTKSHADAATDLASAWKVNWDGLKAAWDAQEAADRACVAKEKQDAELEDEWKEAERKKPKQKEFDARKRVGDTIAPCASAFTLEKLRTFKYCEAWYFTQEGCADAAEHQRSVANTNQD